MASMQVPIRYYGWGRNHASLEPDAAIAESDPLEILIAAEEDHEDPLEHVFPPRTATISPWLGRIYVRGGEGGFSRWSVLGFHRRARTDLPDRLCRRARPRPHRHHPHARCAPPGRARLRHRSDSATTRNKTMFALIDDNFNPPRIVALFATIEDLTARHTLADNERVLDISSAAARRRPKRLRTGQGRGSTRSHHTVMASFDAHIAVTSSRPTRPFRRSPRSPSQEARSNAPR